MSGSQKRKIRKEKEYNINSKYAKLDNFLISASSSSCASASSSNWYWARTRDKASHGPIPIPLGYRGHGKRSKGKGCGIQHDFMLLTVSLTSIENLRNNFANIKEGAIGLAKKWGITPEFEKRRHRKVRQFFNDFNADEKLQD
ncbi:hypothetical protein TNCV_3697201 [Trichonephila clavipes]|uniref:Uncharacterized protein n=1 Tax=Trichonephila clavipes TaxID=2585209 RepID=A0A8X6VJA3_TRICX|nr:hypothetical protein TNCV_3697201 [Trichonephila clavipes]